MIYGETHMKLKNSYFYTLRENPNDEESTSGTLLIRGGFIKKSSSGVYMFMVTAKGENPSAPDPAAIRSQKQQSFMQGLRNIQQVLKDHAKVVDQRNKFF